MFNAGPLQPSHIFSTCPIPIWHNFLVGRNSLAQHYKDTYLVLGIGCKWYEHIKHSYIKICRCKQVLQFLQYWVTEFC